MQHACSWKAAQLTLVLHSGDRTLGHPIDGVRDRLRGVAPLGGERDVVRGARALRGPEAEILRLELANAEVCKLVDSELDVGGLEVADEVEVVDEVDKALGLVLGGMIDLSQGASSAGSEFERVAQGVEGPRLGRDGRWKGSARYLAEVRLELKKLGLEGRRTNRRVVVDHVSR